jgi:hypothetical protein
MKVGQDDTLYLVDSYKGLLRISLDTGNIEILLSNEEGIYDIVTILFPVKILFISFNLNKLHI